jgi:glycine/D-amino acid oxidase-like deaminating enzyme
MAQNFTSLCHPDFKDTPYWWEAAAPSNKYAKNLTDQCEIFIIGAGYSGLNAALELAHKGHDVCVSDAETLGFAASSRNGGGVSAGTNLGKGISGTPGQRGDDEAGKAVMEALLAESAAALSHLERVLKEENIDCFYQQTGRFVGAYTPEHFEAFKPKLEMVEKHTGQGLTLLPRERQREAIGSDFYFGGMIVERASKLHPALYHHGLLAACHRAGVRLVANNRVQSINGKKGAFDLTTDQGSCRAEQVIIATNGYTDGIAPELRQRLVPVSSHIIATEELPTGLCEQLFPGGRNISETPRILHYYRPCPENKRVIFGGRAKFTDIGVDIVAPILHARMLERFPELEEVKITHCWSGNVAFTMDNVPHLGELRDGVHYCVGCNGSGVSMLSYLGYLKARQIHDGTDFETPYAGRPFPKVPLPFYTGNPWFLPILGSFYQHLDQRERRRAGG